jgi:hypothetical protein
MTYISSISALSLLGLEDSDENLTDINESLISRPIVVHGTYFDLLSRSKILKY